MDAVKDICITNLHQVFEALANDPFFLIVFNDEQEIVFADPEAYINIRLHLQGDFIKKIEGNSKLIKFYIPLSWQALQDFITMQRELAIKTFKLN